ncbi:hypothetical protein PMG71_20880 [Roseofilum sp. BLCC_M154]|uniref:Uncharacterized protein n=1 Tax=Roseofilum acuticapitatum BLCC-M154 TaxID=3022444 RepID=A0ABT7AYB4_9CYAN|nr:hypothetical protein [Roseofilum acuticapitatum]MDJ1171888.1 hypothetical protein [Roseofilum acuticapitatum BLCC-M154]
MKSALYSTLRSPSLAGPTFRHRSDKEVDYRYLQHLLQQQQWKEADDELRRPRFFS